MANVAAALTARWESVETRIHYVAEFYDPGWEATERFTERELGVAELGHDGYHDDIWVTAMMMATDPEQVRFAQRVDAGLASINGVSIVPMEETIKLGRKMVEFRAEFTANAIRGFCRDPEIDSLPTLIRIRIGEKIVALQPARCRPGE